MNFSTLLQIEFICGSCKKTVTGHELLLYTEREPYSHYEHAVASVECPDCGAETELST